MKSKAYKIVVIIVAHPDAQILWTGGIILNNPQWNFFINSLCRKNDENRSSKFYKVLKILNAQGIMGNLDDEPDQKPLKTIEVFAKNIGFITKKNILI